MMSLNDKIIKYLRKYGFITQKDAIKEFDCYRLAPRIYDLRNLGFDILTIPEPNRGGGTHAKYVLCNHLPAMP